MKIAKKWIVIFLLPATLLFCFVYSISFMVLVVTSFADWRIGSGITFVGLKNYQQLFLSDTFRAALINTLKWMLLQCSIHVFIGVVFAFITSGKTRGARFSRAVFMIPNIISSAALGMLYLCILNPQFGLVNTIIRLIGDPNFNQNWFMDPKTAFGTVTMIWLPFAATVAMMARTEMTAVDASLYEAAAMDGATDFQKSFYITLPLIKGAIGAGTIISATSMLQKLDIIMMTTNGGPGTETLNLPLLIYDTAMRENNFSLASAEGMVLIIIGLVAIAIISRIYHMDIKK